MGIGGTEPGTNHFTVSDAELSRMTVLSGGFTLNKIFDASGIDGVQGLTVGNSFVGEVAASGVTDASTANIGRVVLVAHKIGMRVVFNEAPSSFNKGITVQSYAGIVLDESLTTKNTGTYFNSGANQGWLYSEWD